MFRKIESFNFTNFFVVKQHLFIMNINCFGNFQMIAIHCQKYLLYGFTTKQILFLKNIWCSRNCLKLFSSLPASPICNVMNPEILSTIRFYDGNAIYRSHGLRNCRMLICIYLAFLLLLTPEEGGTCVGRKSFKAGLQRGLA